MIDKLKNFILRRGFLRHTLPSKFVIDRDARYIFSVIIPTYNRSYLLEKLLDSWLKVKLVTPFAFEIIFSDDGSTDHTIEILSNYTLLDLKIVKNSHIGPAMARNEAIKLAEGQKIIFCGDDIFPDQDLLIKHYSKLKKLPVNVAVLGSIDWHEDINTNHLMKHITEIGNEQFSFNRLPQNKYVDFRHFYTSNLSIDKNFLTQVSGPFSEDFYKVNFEDTELGYRLALRGMKILFFPEAHVQHHHVYNSVSKFCERQFTAGEMGLIFRKLHPKIDWVVQFSQIADKWGTIMLGEAQEIKTYSIDDVIKIAQLAEDRGIYKMPGIDRCLSAIYLAVFRFFYEKGLMKNYADFSESVQNKVFNTAFLPSIYNDIITIQDIISNGDECPILYDTPVPGTLVIHVPTPEILGLVKQYYSDFEDEVTYLDGSQDDLKGSGVFLYTPDPDNLIMPNNLRQILLYLQSNENIDQLILSYGLVDLPFIGLKNGLHGQTIYRIDSIDKKIKSGKIIRLHSESFSEKIHSKELGLDVKLNVFGYWNFSSTMQRFSFYKRNHQEKNKKVIFIFPTFLAMGGVEKHILSVIQCLKTDFDFVIVNFERLHEHLGSLHQQFASLCRGIYDLTELSTHDSIPDFLRQLKYDYKPDLIWICNGSPWLSSELQFIRRVFYQIPIIDHQAYDDKEGWISLYREKDLNLLSFDCFVAINSRIMSVFRNISNIDETKIRLIYHAIDTRKFNPEKVFDTASIAQKYNLDIKKRIFVFVGRLTEQKRPQLFIELVKHVIRKNNDCHFIMVGNGPLSREVNRLISMNDLASRITLVPRTDNLEELYALAAGLIITSSYEGLPISMLEAMAMGVPVFSTDVGDIHMVIREFENGACVDPALKKTALFEAFDQFNSNLQIYKNNAVSSAEIIRERFAENKISEAYSEIFHTTIHAKLN